MNRLIEMNNATAVFFVVLGLGCFCLSPAAHALNPPPDGGYPGGNTAEGDSALFFLTTGCCNTAIGAAALEGNTTGGFNTATGRLALNANTTATGNTADGEEALRSNTTGFGNTATG